MNSKNTKPSSEELRQKVLTQLDRIDTDIDEIQGRMTPGSILDDAIFYPRGCSPAATIDLLKNNPVATTFLTLGTLLLMEDETHLTYEQKARVKVGVAVDQGRIVVEQGRHMIDTSRTRVSGMVDQVRDGIESVKNRFHTNQQDAVQLLDSVKDRITTAVDSTKHVVTDLKNEVSHKLSDSEGTRSQAIDDAMYAFGTEDDASARSGSKLDDLKSSLMDHLPDTEGISARVNDAYDTASTKVSGALDAASDKVSSVASSLREGVSTGMQEGVMAVRGLDPLTYVAIGAGLGTLTGISLPISEAEQRLVDSKLDGTISSFTQEMQAALEESAGILKQMVVSDFKSFSIDSFLR